MIRMTITRHDHLPRPSIPLLHHDLVSDPPPRRIEIHPMLGSESFDLFVFCEVGGGVVLDVVVEGEDGLFGVEDFGALEGGESGGKDKPALVSGLSCGSD